MRGSELGDLLAFVAVAEDRSFTRAAAKLGVSQSALSFTVRRLEARLGLRLLNRTTRSVAPTEGGERLLRTLRPAFDQIDAELSALVPPGESPAGGRVEGGTRPIGGSRLGGESTSEARREGLVPLQTRLVPSGRREATDAGNRWPNFCRTVLGGVAFSLSRPAGEGRGEGCG